MNKGDIHTMVNKNAMDSHFQYISNIALLIIEEYYPVECSSAGSIQPTNAEHIILINQPQNELS